ncbi:general stress protein [Hanamia caeni]|jgi:general stress protein 26|uniref:General stress protein n=1 Tax=Hanamia caeni TaxID=2294116 RepID=A0A3M9N9N7_9BACT|nr:pyridoxamine 5'-phosphate oxidase family protein [Hanamia caeni]RNI34494.1 general stress protein [Hanamia caeni]
MDSINKNQDGTHKENLSNAEAAKKIKELANKNTCFFCTNLATGTKLNTRPMSVQKVDDEGNLYFLSAKDSHKNRDIAVNPKVQLFFQGSAHSDFLTLYGTATISDDKALIKELWEPLAKAWFTEGENDPRISVIKIASDGGYYWDNKHGNAIALLKVAAGALIGKTMDDSIEGALKV